MVTGDNVMGQWANKYFNQTELPRECYIFAGTAKNDFKNDIIKNFDEVLYHDLGIFEKYIVCKGGMKYTIIFQVFGAPMIIDLIHILKDGGVQKIIFFGAAFGINESLEVGDCVVPIQVQSLEGILETVEHKKYAYPDEKLARLMIDGLKLNSIDVNVGKVVSVPSVFVKPDKEIFDEDLYAIEMETACLFHYSKELKIRCSAILIISDTKTHKLYNSQDRRYQKMVDVFKVLFNRNN